MNDSTPADRIRSARQLKRGLTQKELAERSGMSVSLISKYEQGTAVPTAETLHKLAKGLRIKTTVLLGAPAADLADEPDVTAWEPVRQAIAGCHDAIPGDGPTLDGLTDAIGGMVPLVLASEHEQLRLLLPGVLRDADLLVAASGGGHEQQGARALRSRARQLAGYLLCMTWQLDAAGDVLDLALDDAAGDRHLEMAAAHWRCWALMRSGDLDGCGSLASRWADETEPRLSRAAPDELALWGRFQVLVATAAARDNRPGEAGQALRIASAAAAALDGREVVPAANPWDVFGPRTVAMVRGEIAVVQDKPDVALRIGEKIRGDDFPVPRNWLRHRLDVAAAHAARPSGRMDAAAVLQDIRAVAPQWLAQQHKARDVLAVVLRAPKRVPPPELRQLAELVRLPMS
jgi:transcriptional regulator with XRE-family HTH domain